MIKKDTKEDLVQGDIILIDLSPTFGHEQAGSRPVIVVTNTAVLPQSNTVAVVPLSTKLKEIPGHVRVWPKGGKPSVAKLEHLRSVDLKVRPWKYLDHVSESEMEEISDTLQLMFEKDM